jgi:MYXO-CTERM domain-containing protein
VQFYVTNAVDCFGMDEFYINEAAPGVPDSASTSLLMLLGVAGLVVGLRRRN